MIQPELKILLQEKSGQTWTSGMTWKQMKEQVQKVEFLEKTTSKLWDEIYSIHNRLDELETPQRKQSIIDLLKGQGRHSIKWLRHRVTRVFDSDIKKLVADKILIETWSGRTRMYEVKS